MLDLRRWVLAVLAFIPLASAAQPPSTIDDPSFESSALGPWDLRVYGASATAGFDALDRHAGKQSLRISSTELSDAAVGQEVRLAPRQWYRFSGWVKTSKLRPSDATTFGTFQIQNPGGAGVIAAGANHSGDNDWTQVPIFFEAPADGRMRVSAFFAGFGKGTGTAWFDDLSLTPVDLAREPVRITREPLVGEAARVSPFQYGQFLEYLCDSVGSIWAEKLYDGGFEGLSPYKVVYRKESDFKEKSWYPSGATSRAKLSLDEQNPVCGKSSQRIEVGADDKEPGAVGVSQDGVAVSRDVACDFSCYLRGEKLRGPVEVVLHRDRERLAIGKFEPTGEWKKFGVELKPSRTETNATLTIRFMGPGTLWIDAASLMPRDNVAGWRRDAVEAIRAAKPGILRFGGSALDSPEYGDFEWRDTIGEPAKRKTLRAWGGLQPFGAGLEEIVRLCQAVNAEPLICVRTLGRTPKDAADEVEFFNGAPSTPMGKLRAANGHREPYRIKFWQIGNERSGAEYEAQIAPFAKAMRAVDPGIRVLSSFPSPATLQLAGGVIDYVCPHQYACADLVGTENELLSVQNLVKRLGPPDRRIGIAVTEWNTTAGDWGPGRAKLLTLANGLAVARYQNLLHRHADVVDIANRSNLANSFCSGMIQTDNHRLYKSPAYYAQMLYATLGETKPLKIESDVPASACPDFSATMSEDGKTLTLFAVNDRVTEVTRPVDLSAFGALRSSKVAITTLADTRRGDSAEVANDFDDPQRIAPNNSQATVNSNGRFDYRFPPFSLTVMVFDLGR